VGNIPHEQRYTEYLSRRVKPIWPKLNSLCSLTGRNPAQKIQFRFLSNIFPENVLFGKAGSVQTSVEILWSKLSAADDIEDMCSCLIINDLSMSKTVNTIVNPKTKIPV